MNDILHKVILYPQKNIHTTLYNTEGTSLSRSRRTNPSMPSISMMKGIIPSILKGTSLFKLGGINYHNTNNNSTT
jgi:hypothetical protein